MRRKPLIAARARAPRALRGAVLLGVLAVAGCASLPTPRTTAVPRFEQARSAYEIAGRLSARHDADAFAANFRWTHQGDHDELDLASPLGQTVARLSGDATGVRLQTPDGKTQSAGDWETLTSRGLGWELPVAGLSYWIQGVPRQNAPFTSEYASDGTPSVLRQDGWTIAYQAFVRDGAGTPRPGRMTLDYPGVELRVVIDTWQ